MLFPLIKTNVVNTQFKLYKPFIVKSKFIDLEFRKCSSYRDFRVDYFALVDNEFDYQSLIRAWYLVLALRMVKTPLVATRTAVFPYRRTKLFAKHQDIYDLSISKHFYDTVIEHRDLFYYLTISTFSIDRLYLILCLYSLKTKTSGTQTVIRKCSTSRSLHNDLVDFILKNKWKFKLIKFTT